MLMYVYCFEVNAESYYVYAPSKEEAITRYLKEKGLTDLPTNCSVTRAHF